MQSLKQSTFNRRSFLRASSLAGGGMLIGFNLFTACKSDVKPALDISKLNFNDFNAFIKISDEGIVTIFSPNPEIGQGVKTSMPMLIAEELDVAWENVHVAQGALDNDHFTRQVAGGSQSLRQGWEPLRQTGATARQMLVNAAAAQWGVSASECTTKAGVITNAKGEELSYGAVVKAAAKLEVPEEVALKDPKDFTIIGKEVANVDLESIVTGKSLFGLDYKREGMLYASVLRPPAFGQLLDSYNDDAAKAISGVQKIIKLENKVAVLATSTWGAMQGKKALVATWKTDTKLESTADHDRELIALLDGDKFDTLREDGNVKKAFKEADQIVERTYESPFLPHNCLEPMNFFANVTTDSVELVGPVQTPAWTAGRVATLLGRDPKEVSLQMTRMGGGFGRRLYGDFALEAAEISHLAKKPVQVVFSREDDMADGIYRPAIKYRIAASVKDKKITGYYLKEAAINGNMYGLIPNFFPAAAIENYKVDVANYKSNITTGAWRAPYTNFLAFAEQAFLDELSDVLEVDRVQMRLDLLQKAKGTTDKRIEYEPERLESVLNLAVEKSGWGKAKDGVFQGIAAYYCHNTHVAEVADVVVEDGMPVVKKITCVVDCGIVVNPLGAINQIKGGVIDGIGHAMYGDFAFDKGAPSAVNFNEYRLIRMNETPEVDVHFVKSNVAPTGLGEPTLPPAGAAIANAIFAATGKRLTKQPFINQLSEKEIVG